jgi:hypothetical protein
MDQPTRGANLPLWRNDESSHHLSIGADAAEFHTLHAAAASVDRPGLPGTIAKNQARSGNRGTMAHLLQQSQFAPPPGRGLTDCPVSPIPARPEAAGAGGRQPAACRTAHCRRYQPCPALASYRSYWTLYDIGTVRSVLFSPLPCRPCRNGGIPGAPTGLPVLDRVSSVQYRAVTDSVIGLARQRCCRARLL